MHWMADQIVDDNRTTGYAQCFVGIRDNSTRLKMMRKETARYHVKCSIAERQSQGVAYDAASSFPEVSFHAVQQRYFQLDAAAEQNVPRFYWNLAEACARFQHAKARLPSACQDFAQKL